jgi:hypothetical protein
MCNALGLGIISGLFLCANWRQYSNGWGFLTMTGIQ